MKKKKTQLIPKIVETKHFVEINSKILLKSIEHKEKGKVKELNLLYVSYPFFCIIVYRVIGPSVYIFMDNSCKFANKISTVL